MNVFKMLYCRAHQQAFHLAIPFLPYRAPEIIGSIGDIPSVLKAQGIDSVLLVTGPIVRRRGITAPLEKLLSDEKIHCTVYDKTVANPTIENAEQARQLYLDNGCGAIIAFGGGSPMDCAKAVGARLARPDRPLSQMGGVMKVGRPTPPLIAIPTTAGTGSEVTLVAVITDGETRHKYAISDFSLIPKYAVLDAETTRTMPPSVTAATGMDALTHAVEAYIGCSTTAETRAQALKATELIFGNLKSAYDNGDDMTARQNMLRASYLAGCAFTKSYVGYVHAVAHSLGGRYDISHGLANAVLLPVVLKAYGEAVHKKLHALAVAAKIADSRNTDSAAAQRFIAAIEEMNRSMGIPTVIKEIKEEDIDRLAQGAAQEANPLYPVPVLWEAKDLKRLYYAVMEKQP